MITSIQLGNVFNSGDRTIVSGGNTGFDIEALVTGLTDIRRLPAVQLETQLEENALRQSAFSELRTILANYRDASDLLRNPPGVNNSDENIFEYRNSSLSTNDGTDASTYLSVTAAPGAALSNYDITVDSVAGFNTKTTETFALADVDTDAVGAGLPFNAGILTLGPNDVEIEIEADDTLSQIITKINAVEDESGVRATALQVSDGNYRLQFKTTQTGADQNYALVDTALNIPGIVARFDATDFDGDGDTTDNPADGANLNGLNFVDSVGGNTAGETGAANPTLAGAAINGNDAIDFSTATASLFVPDTTAAINAGVFQEKTFAFAIQTGADVSGTQTIYEQGGNTNSFGVFIAPDPANSNAPTLFATTHVAAWGAEQYRTVNLGTVSPNTDYNIVVEFDASANPGANDPANELRGYVNGTLIDTETNIAQLPSHTGAIGLGGSTGGVGLPNETTSSAQSNFYQGLLGEVILTNNILTPSEFGNLNSYLASKWQGSASAGNNAIFNVGLAFEEDATDAQLTIDGTTITRSSNTIDDLLEDVTFNLNQVTPTNTEVTVDIEPDTEIVSAAVSNFVDSYNALRVFVSRQNEVDDNGQFVEGAVLSNDSTLRSLVNSVANELSRVVTGLATEPNKLADLGITLDDFQGDEETPFTRNILVIDPGELNNALAADFDAVRDVFEFDFTSDSSDVQIFSRSNALDVTDFELNVDLTNGIYEARTTTGALIAALDAEPITGGGLLLKGQNGTDLEGLELIFGGTADTTANISISQGIGDRIFNILDSALDQDGGIIQTELDSIADSNDRLNEDILRIDEIVERFRQQQLARFAQLESLISSANTILQSLDAAAAAAANR